MQDGLLTIGRSARLCRLGAKRLPHHDETGLSAPARVDAGSGYRCHAPEQARDALTFAQPPAYRALSAAVHECGPRPQAPVREACLVGPAAAPREEAMTRLIIPVQESMA
ncbi:MULTISPECIES: hypothetical protein [Streptosporangium]|uniref:Uncharacterized protein n=1 Tax=Streptosporangium brasiliense TaxID=47480 RepID=A0ABT9RDK8_9ACTN|nr:hypothetical protein [Streptosporangium brasiliense]MDP9867344.1 hypothetical protein [Streptosporangium brasiliense]